MTTLRKAALAEFDASLTDPTKISVHQTAEPAQPVAWYVERRAPGYGDDGVKSGPWWSKNAAKRFADDHHVLRPLYPADAIREAVLAEREAISKFCADVYEESASFDDGLDPFENGIKWTTEQISSWIEKRGAA